MRRLNKSLPLRLGIALVAIGAVIALIAIRPFSSESDVDQVKEVIDRVFTTNDPSICFDLVTPRFLEVTYGKGLDQATKKCQESQANGSGAATSVELEALTIDGPNAGARVAVHGGALDRRTAAATLVDTDGWRLDTLRLSEPLPTAKETRSAVDEGIRRGLIERQGFKKKRADCVVAYLREHVSDAQLAEDLKTLQRGEIPADFTQAFAACK